MEKTAAALILKKCKKILDFQVKMNIIHLNVEKLECRYSHL